MIIIPTYNERDNIATLVARIRNAAGAVSITFADDSSPDGTADEILELAESDPGIFLMKRPVRNGRGSAYRDAFRKVLAQGRAEYIVMMDADLTHPPEFLPRLIERLDEYPVVVGSRFTAGGGIKNWSWMRRKLSFCGNLYARILTGVPVADLSGGFVAMTAKSLRTIDMDTLNSDGYAFNIEIKYLLHCAKNFIYEVPVTFTEHCGRPNLSGRLLWKGILFPLKILVRRYL